MTKSPLLLLALAGAALPLPALADEPPPRINVTGRGSVFTPPDLAVIVFGVHGEGASSDAALSALVATRKAIDGGIRGLVREEAKGGEVSVRAVRARECDVQSYGPPRLDTGACAITGYVADLELTIRTGNVAKAATTAGLIARLGGREPRVTGYELADPRAAQRRAMAAALIDAMVRAKAVAEGAGVQLGALLFASDGSGSEPPNEIVVTGSRIAAPAPPPPPPPPVNVDVTPRPIETVAVASVAYRIP